MTVYTFFKFQHSLRSGTSTEREGGQKPPLVLSGSPCSPEDDGMASCLLIPLQHHIGTWLQDHHIQLPVSPEVMVPQCRVFHRHQSLTSMLVFTEVRLFYVLGLANEQRISKQRIFLAHILYHLCMFPCSPHCSSHGHCSHLALEFSDFKSDSKSAFWNPPPRLIKPIVSTSHKVARTALPVDICLFTKTHICTHNSFPPSCSPSCAKRDSGTFFFLEWNLHFLNFPLFYLI